MRLSFRALSTLLFYGTVSGQPDCGLCCFDVPGGTNPCFPYPSTTKCRDANPLNECDKDDYCSGGCSCPFTYEPAGTSCNGGFGECNGFGSCVDISPSPSSAPSSSGAPSSSPSMSSMPSDLPSDNPSTSPSTSLMPSSLPSDAPSNGPSVSSAPSSGPIIVSNFLELSAAIEDATDPANPARIAINPGTISFTEDIIYLGKHFTIECTADDPTLCVFDMNGNSFFANGFGTGTAQSSASFRDLSFINGVASEALDRGGAIGLLGSSSTLADLTVVNCIFENNTGESGGAIGASYANVIIRSCTFKSNAAIGGNEIGGAVVTSNCPLSITDSIFTNNSAEKGGAVHFFGPSYSPTISGSVFFGNTASDSGADIYGEDFGFGTLPVFQCGDGTNSFCDASASGVSTNDPTSLCSGSAVGPDSPGCPTVDCPEGFITCCRGYKGECDAGGNPTSTTSTCTDACNGFCCARPIDCVGFTGRICRDGSCSKTRTNEDTNYGACQDATIGEVVNGCIGSSRICQSANITKVINGCQQYGACTNTGENGGYVGLIDDSCIGSNACNNLGGGEGSVEVVVGSCLGEDSCFALGSGGFVGRLQDSCLLGGSCNRAGFGGSIQSIVQSCLQFESCAFLASEGGLRIGGSAGDIIRSCDETRSCKFLGDEGGSVQNVIESCKSVESCISLGSTEPAVVGDVLYSCLKEESCNRTALGGTVDLLNGSCLTPKACESFREGDNSTSIPSFTCTLNSTGAFSPSSATCIDGAGGIGMCEGSSASCTTAPSAMPSTSPAPSAAPSVSSMPSSVPSTSPSSSPSQSPSEGPSVAPSAMPSETPSNPPSSAPSTSPSQSPSKDPSIAPSAMPSEPPSNPPTSIPSTIPSQFPSEDPSIAPSSSPSVSPAPTPFTEKPSSAPSTSPAPSDTPSSTPSVVPSGHPSLEPSSIPSAVPTSIPSASPSSKPSANPSFDPTTSRMPSDAPSTLPSTTPSTTPSFEPSTVPSPVPSGTPSTLPSKTPSTPPSISSAPTISCPDDNEVYLPSNYWIPPLDKPGMSCDSVRLKISDHGEFSCLPVGEGICRDNGGYFGKWRFGIEQVSSPPCELFGECPVSAEETDKFPVLIDPALKRYPITGTTFTDSKTGKICKNGYGEAIRGCNYAGTTHICISENIEKDTNRYSDERPFMFFYNEKKHQYLYQLVCDGIGEQGKLPQLKMVNQEELADKIYVDYPVDIVKFKKGATPNTDDSNELWKMYMDWNGFEDPDARRIGKLASFIGVAHPNLCKEYVSATDKACWKVDCDDGSVATPEAYERDDCIP